MHIAELRNKKEDILKLANIFGVKEIRIFGSVARNKQDRGSDIDFLVEMEKNKSLFDRFGFKHELEQLLQQKVDVISIKAIHGRLKENILKESLPL
ncbi:MAG: nucleotidyltransferase [Ignavibacteria bacterium]|nr:MAG: nucleotidyltransferase [Ignavibacteria bacterium]KAF0162441.1 MAG: nucleotidyltransferase [Ignavibacteria bacterium]